jgi:hypothetical protein
MIYRCQKIPIERLVVLPSGIFTPLCNSCGAKDCDNPIEPVQISIMGVAKTMKAYNVSGRASFVYECEGFIDKNLAHKRSVDLNGIQPISEAKKTNQGSPATDD